MGGRVWEKRQWGEGLVLALTRMSIGWLFAIQTLT